MLEEIVKNQEEHFMKWSNRFDELRSQGKEINHVEQVLATAEHSLGHIQEFINMVKKEFPDDAASIVRECVRVQSILY